MGGRERCGQKGGQKNWLNMKNNRRSMLEARTFGLDSSFKYEETDPRKTMSDQNYLETYDLRRVWNRAIQCGSLWPHIVVEHLKCGQSSPN